MTTADRQHASPPPLALSDDWVGWWTYLSICRTKSSRTLRILGRGCQRCVLPSSRGCASTNVVTPPRAPSRAHAMSTRHPFTKPRTSRSPRSCLLSLPRPPATNKLALLRQEPTSNPHRGKVLDMAAFVTSSIAAARVAEPWRAGCVHACCCGEHSGSCHTAAATLKRPNRTIHTRVVTLPCECAITGAKRL